MKNFILMLFAFVCLTGFSQETRKEIDLPMPVYDCLVKIRDSKWNKDYKFPLPEKITEVSDNNGFLRYEFSVKDYDFTINKKNPYDYVLEFTDKTKPYFSFTFYFINSSYSAINKFISDNGTFWVSFYTQKRFEGSMHLKK